MIKWLSSLKLVGSRFILFDKQIILISVYNKIIAYVISFSRCYLAVVILKKQGKYNNIRGWVKCSSLEKLGICFHVNDEIKGKDKLFRYTKERTNRLLFDIFLKSKHKGLLDSLHWLQD